MCSKPVYYPTNSEHTHIYSYQLILYSVCISNQQLWWKTEEHCLLSCLQEKAAFTWIYLAGVWGKKLLFTFLCKYNFNKSTWTCFSLHHSWRLKPQFIVMLYLTNEHKVLHTQKDYSFQILLGIWRRCTMSMNCPETWCCYTQF